MKKSIVLFGLAALFFTVLSACNPVPTKELNEAKAAIEKAETVEAPFYAASEYKSAKDDYDSANKLVEDKKNKDAKEKAISSKEQALQAYTIANQKRADDIYNKDKNLLSDAKQNFGEKLKPEDFSKASKDFDALSSDYTASNYIVVYSNGMSLYSNLTILVNYLKGESDKARNAIAQAQDKYDQAENDDIVREFAMDDLKKALPLLNEARKAFDDANLVMAMQKAQEAETQVDNAVTKAQDAYQKYLEQKRQAQLKLDLEKKKQQELEKKKADEYLKKAQDMLQKLKGSNQDGMLLPGQRLYTPVYRKMNSLGQSLKIIDESTQINTQSTVSNTRENENISVNPENKDVDEEKVTQETVEKYVKLAKESYDKGEYLDSVDYSREALRLGEILLNRQTMKTYTVENHPGNEDCLWKISGKMYNKMYWMWPIIWRANKYKIQDPDLIYPGQKFKIPPSLIK